MPFDLFRHLFLCATACFFLFSCAPASEWELVKPEYKVLRSEDKEMERIQEQSTIFMLRKTDLRAAWQRAELFSEQYLGIIPSYVYQSGKFRPDTVALQFASENFSYTVQKEAKGPDFVLRINCSAKSAERGAKEKAELNAKNLARFVQHGRLQVALIEK